MAGLAILIDPESLDPRSEVTFDALVRSTRKYKLLTLPAIHAQGSICYAAKLDAAASLHTGVIRDARTGSWLIAAGTVIALVGNNDPRILLKNLLRQYQLVGQKALEQYDGHFALAIYDRLKDTLSVISDPMGNFSVFYARKGRQILLSTSALAIASLIQPETDVLAMEGFLRSGMLIGDRTFWTGIQRISPASVYVFSRDRLEISEYWSPTFDENTARLSLKEASECAGEMMTDVMALALKREGRVWADLTGGFDTRVTTTFLVKARVPFVAYSVGPENHPDVQIPKQICREKGWEHRHMPLPEDWSQLQHVWLQIALGKGDARLNLPSLARVLYGQQERSMESKVNVTGLGADEWREIANPGADIFNWGKTYSYDRLLDAAILSPVPRFVMHDDRENQVRDEWRQFLSRVAARYSQYPNYVQGHAMFIRYRYPGHGGAHLSACSGIMRTISPFCFKAPVNFGFSLPHLWRIHYLHIFIRSLLETEDPSIARFPVLNGGSAGQFKIGNLSAFLPLWITIFDRGINHLSRSLFRKSFHLRQQSVTEYPLTAWQNALFHQAKFDSLLTPSRMASERLYRPEALQSLSDQVERGQAIFGSFLERIMTIEMAMRSTGTCIN